MEMEMEMKKNEEGVVVVFVHNGGCFENVEERCWDDMIPDALGLIFKNLPLKEVLTVVPLVCQSWRKAVLGPYCWQEIDIEDWSRHCDGEQLYRMLELLLGRSSGSLKKLAVYGLPDDNALSMIADHANSLEYLSVPQSLLSDAVVEQVAERFRKLTHLDLSYCESMGARALRAIGTNCKSLVYLNRAMHPLGVLDLNCQDDEAYAIAETMPRLKHLIMTYVLLTTSGVRAIVLGCKELELLDVRGCWDVNFGDEEWFVKRREKGLKILGPVVVDRYNFHYVESCSEDEDDDEWGSMGDYNDWGTVVSYDGIDEDAWDDEGVDGGGVMWPVENNLVWDDDGGLAGFEVRVFEVPDDANDGFGW